MFCRHSRFAIDAFLGLQDIDKKPMNHPNYAEQLKERMALDTKKQRNRLPKRGQI